MSEIVSHELFNNKPLCNELKNIIEFQNKAVYPKMPCNFPHYSSFEDRMKSFKNWPESSKIKSKALSDAGFFYLGHDDRTVCFHCGGGLNEWKEFDDPWVEHAYWFPKCKFILNEKGQEFIDKAVGKKAEIISAQKSETIVSTIDEIMDLIHSKRKIPLNKSKKEVESTIQTDSEKKETSFNLDSENKIGQNSQSSLLCKVCFSEEKNILFFPCKHVAVCKQCSVSLSNCPICRQTIVDTMRIYNS